MPAIDIDECPTAVHSLTPPAPFPEAYPIKVDPKPALFVKYPRDVVSPTFESVTPKTRPLTEGVAAGRPEADQASPFEMFRFPEDESKTMEPGVAMLVDASEGTTGTTKFLVTVRSLLVSKFVVMLLMKQKNILMFHTFLWR
ncbi:hypothetical protein [Brazilian marseillevirus]|uniref:hypothetical protein n=1 Tax=Brazilian marseillevirus TaxID=1813599 RepID=UPI0007858C6F|nr:hypothetical protein A3303_gp041 [Brazilian marseillevirus]AMQ10549.1 hypothetical protein [Brazilian marseillevirus]